MGNSSCLLYRLRATTSLGQFRGVPVLLDAVPQHLHYAAHLRDDRRSRYFAAFDSLCSLAFYLQTLKFMHFRSAAVWGTELLGGPARTEVHDILLVHSCARVHALPYLQLALHRWRIILLHVEDHPAILSVSAHLGIQLRGICVRAHIRSFVGQSAALRAEAGRICGQCHQACHREGPGEAQGAIPGLVRLHPDVQPDCRVHDPHVPQPDGCAAGAWLPCLLRVIRANGGLLNLVPPLLRALALLAHGVGIGDLCEMPLGGVLLLLPLLEGGTQGSAHLGCWIPQGGFIERLSKIPSEAPKRKKKTSIILSILNKEVNYK